MGYVQELVWPERAHASGSIQRDGSRGCDAASRVRHRTLHTTPPSAAAPRPRGILKNAPPGEGLPSQHERVDEHGNR